MPADVHDQLARAVASFDAVGGPDVARAYRRGRVLRRRRRVAAAAAVALVLGGAVSGTLLATGGSNPSVRVAPPSGGSTDGATTVTNDQFHVSWRVPGDWQSTTTKLTTNLIDPAGVLATGTFALRPDPGACLTPAVAQNMAPTDVYVALFVWLHANGGFPARPPAFGPDLGSTDVLPCIQVPRGTARLIDFTEQGIELTALVIIGNESSPERQADAFSVLDSIRVEP